MKDSVKTAVFIQKMDETSRIIDYVTNYITGTDDSPILPFASNIPYTPVKGDRLWFYPGCDIPRFKVKQFCLKYQIAVVKYREKSSVRFVGPETIKTLVFRHSGYYCQKDYFLQWLDTVMCNAYLQLKDDIIKSQSDTVYLGYAVHKFCNKDLFGDKVLSQINDVDYGGVYFIKTEESYQQIIDMCNDQNLRPQDDLLSLLNTGVEMDEKMFNEIHRLFESTDKENTKLAMEAMANCDFQKSAVYLLMLIQKYGTKIYNSGNKHHVNFKSLIKYFKIENLTTMSVDDMINSLRHQKLLSVDNLNRLMPMAMETLRSEGEMDNIKIKDLELSPEAEKSVAENILDPKPVQVVPSNPELEQI